MNFQEFKKIIIPLEWRTEDKKVLARAYVFDREVNFVITHKDDYCEYVVSFGRRELKGCGSTLEKAKENAFHTFALVLSCNYNIEIGDNHV